MKEKRFKVRRLLLAFSKKTDALVHKYELRNFKLKEAQKLFGEEPWDPMYCSYVITEKEAPYFRTKYGRRFNFKKYEYCLDCERIE